MRKILKYAASKDIYGLERWGEHKHYNLNVVVGNCFRDGSNNIAETIWNSENAPLKIQKVKRSEGGVGIR